MKAHFIILPLCLLLACGREAEQLKAPQERGDFNDDLVRGFSSLSVETPLKSTLRAGSLVIIPNPDDTISNFEAVYPNWDQVLNNPVAPLSYQARLPRSLSKEDSAADVAEKLAILTLAISEFKDETYVRFNQSKRKEAELSNYHNQKLKDRVKAMPCFEKDGDQSKCYGKKGRDGNFRKMTLRQCGDFVVREFTDLSIEQVTEKDALMVECNQYLSEYEPVSKELSVLTYAREASTGNLAAILGQLKEQTGADHVAHIFSEEKKGNSCPPGLTECLSRVVLSADKTRLEDLELFMEFGGSVKHFSIKNRNIVKPALHVRSAWNGRPLYILAFGLYDKEFLLAAQLEMTLREDLALRFMGTVTMTYPDQSKRSGYMKLEADFAQ